MPLVPPVRRIQVAFCCIASDVLHTAVCATCQDALMLLFEKCPGAIKTAGQLAAAGPARLKDELTARGA